jgi:hypothetical protein
MEILLNPFKLFVGLMLLLCRVTGYAVIFAIRTMWLIYHRRPVKVGEAFGDFAKSVVDATNELFHQR